ncbi:unnamed protein product [Notodromas monacha]|uniref:Uncharacterized protein n=1 Tax=Notodromas monacha TaxID=399045 RepID=A0A7R9GFM2_9CRUS|nr:unnamed protein product [Notodromas monacha]CAG0920926.1 unnamed protein product [Notodromas monacha]
MCVCAFFPLRQRQSDEDWFDGDSSEDDVIFDAMMPQDEDDETPMELDANLKLRSRNPGNQFTSDSSQSVLSAGFADTRIPKETEPMSCLRCGEADGEMSLEHPDVLHQCVCRACAEYLASLPKYRRKCPMCGRRFKNFVKVYVASCGS